VPFKFLPLQRSIEGGPFLLPLLFLYKTGPSPLSFLTFTHNSPLPLLLSLPNYPLSFPRLSLSLTMKKTISKVSKIFNGSKKSKEDENVSSITHAQLGEMRGVIPPDYGVQEATGTTLERNPDTSRRLVVHYDSVRMGCRFPLHPLLIELCNRYAIPP
ncbi:unnamed protein product, partial [Cuscuta campestris]